MILDELAAYAAERVKVRAADGWKLVEPFVQREERE